MKPQQTYINGFGPENVKIGQPVRGPRYKIFNLEYFIKRQKEFSEKTFGSGPRTLGVTKHIEKELEEIRANPTDLEEWCDVVILALDGAWRAGYEPSEVCKMLQMKQNKNINRKWPAPTSQDIPVEHIE